MSSSIFIVSCRCPHHHPPPQLVFAFSVILLSLVILCLLARNPFLKYQFSCSLLPHLPLQTKHLIFHLPGFTRVAEWRRGG